VTTTISLASPSEADRLDQRILSWAQARGWTGLRDIQVRAIDPIMKGDDVLIPAPTASGKTEACFFPLCSRLAAHPTPGVGVLYISPLKALIDDLAERLDDLCRSLGIPVHPWHGDIASSRKDRVRRNPSGILLMTPESLEATFILRGGDVPRLFGSTIAVVLDEVHSFPGTERGAQVRSLLHRLELSVGRRIQRVGLSATIGNVDTACEFLRPGGGPGVTVVASADPMDLRLQIRGYPAPSDEVAADVFRLLRGQDNLVFANSRAQVEAYADLLAHLSARVGVPNEFHPHHGSLSKEVRKTAEGALKEGPGPATVICTTTLELGIDVGTVRSVAQIGPPPTVAGLRQRLGRSGRRGDPAILRIFVTEGEGSSPVGALRTSLVQSMACVRLLEAGWYEPTPPGVRHLSTLVQQVLSVVAERGGASPAEAHRALGASPGAAFGEVAQAEFARLLRSLGARGLLEQAEDGALLLGEQGERLMGDYTFYAAFSTPQEYRVVAEGETLGTLSRTRPLSIGEPMVFAGRRWTLRFLDHRRRLIGLTPASEGDVPEFGGSAIPVSHGVRQEMRGVYRGTEVPPYLDRTARELLADGRAAFRRLELDRRTVLEWEGDTMGFFWVGDAALDALVLALRRRRVACSVEGPALRAYRLAPHEVLGHLRALASSPPPEGRDLLRGVKNLAQEKHDRYVPPELLVAEHAARALDVAEAWRAIGSLSEQEGDHA
jgi:ATP-dependent Lhr-like helicase